MKTTMHSYFICSTILIFLLLTSLSWAAQLDDEFQARLNAMNEDETITVIAFMKEQVDLRPVWGNPAGVLSALRKTAQRSQASVLKPVIQLNVSGKVTEFHSFWIVNCLSVTGTKDAILTLANDNKYSVDSRGQSYSYSSNQGCSSDSCRPDGP